MQLSKRTQYGLRAMICLADAYQRGYLQTKELSARENLPTKFLESILSALTRGKFLASKIGATGGYRLGRPASEILVGEIIMRLEGKKLFQDEDLLPDGRQEHPGEIGVRLLHAQLSKGLRDVLNSLTLAELAEQVAQQARGDQMYYI